MSRTWQVAVLMLCGFGLFASLDLAPVQPYDSQTLSLIAENNMLLEDWRLDEVQLQDAQGIPVRLSDYRGQWVYLNFWAEWCESCKEEMPELQQFAAQWGDRLQVLTVSIDEDQDAAIRYLNENFPEGSNFNVLFDPASLVAEGYFGTTGVPETFIITPDQQVLSRWVGMVPFTSDPAQRLAEHLVSGNSRAH